MSDDGWLPLSGAQQAIWIGHQLENGWPAFNTAEYVELIGPIDAGVLERAVRQAVGEAEALRLRFRVDGRGQRIGAAPDRVLAVVDLAGEPDPDAAAGRWIDAALARRIDLANGPLFESALLRLSDEHHRWFQLTHHISLDAFGYQLYARRVADLYAALLAADTLPPSRFGALADVLAQDAQYRHGPDRSADRTYWSAVLPAWRTGAGAVPPAGGVRPHRWTGDVPATLVTALAASAGSGVGWTERVIAATGAYLGRCAGTDATVLALPLMNRAGAAGSVPCSTVNLVPVRVADVSRATVGDLVGRVAGQLPDLRRHGRYRAEDLVRDAGAGSGAAFFDAQVNLVPFTQQLRFADTPGTVRNVSAGPVDRLTVCLRGTPQRGPMTLELAGAPHWCGPDELIRHGRRLMAFLERFLTAAADQPAGDVPLPTPDETRLVLAHFNRTEHPVGSRTLPEAFAEQVRRTPDGLAVVDGARSMTYRQLDEQVGVLATRLRAAGVGPGSFVGVELPRSADFLVAVHAVHRAGGAYLPLDPDLPSGRADAMLADAAPVAVLSAPSGRIEITPTGTDHAGDGSGTENRSVRPAHLDDPAYLIFTSGSTGRPKGVVITHRAIDNRLAWMQHHFDLRPGERVLHKTPAGFDVSVWELFWPLQVGATLVIARPGGHRDPRYLADLIADQRVSTVHFVPSMLGAFLTDPTATGTVAAAGCLRRVVCSGEALPTGLAQRARAEWGCRVTNLYGPTEAAVDVTVHDVGPDDDGATVSIGRPIWNTRCYVLDPRRRPVPIGTPGELYLGGVQLALGYHGRPDLTAERFPVAPWAPGERLYATGDLARWRPDGRLEYLGRTDDQVKIRGQRTELGEIDAALAGAPGVAAACSRVDDRGRVIGYLVPAGDGPDLTAVRAHLARMLPDWMVPADLVLLAELPLSGNGKLDRRRLPDPAPRCSAAVAPEDPRTDLLCRLFERVLPGGPDRPGWVGPDQDFFAAGGTSLLALDLLARIEAAAGVRPGIGTFFARPTPAALAGQIGDQTDDLAMLLPLRPHGDGSPLFCVHPAGGLSWCYAGLLPHLPADVPVYGLQAPGLADPSADFPHTIGEMADRYVDLIRGVHPVGPYRLLGWSVGGMVAHEMACRLQARGAMVDLLVLLDAYPSDQWRHLPEPTEADALHALLRIAGAEHAVPDGTVPTRTLVREVLTRRGSALAALPERVVDAVIGIVAGNSRIVRRSEHDRFRGDLLFVTATRPRDEYWLDRAGWLPHLTGRLVNLDLPVSHKDLMAPSSLGRIGGWITERLADPVLRGGPGQPRPATVNDGALRPAMATAHR